MAAVYYKSRAQAGEQAIQAFLPFKNEPLTVVSLDTDSLVIGAELSKALACPLQLYISGQVDIPGGLNIGTVNHEGGFSDNSEMSHYESEGYYQEFRGYIEDAKRTAFSTINRELGSRTVIRRDLLRGRNILIVADCLTAQAPLDSLLTYLKGIAYKKIYICVPIISSELISHIREVSDFSYYAGTVDFFYGKEHYFEDNTVYDRSAGINLVSQYLKLWPAT